MTTFIERYMKKARPEDISYADLRLFLAQQLKESQTLEYKAGGLLVDLNGAVRQPLDDSDSYGFPGLAKSIAGFANAEGGLLVLGVRERKEKHAGQVVRIRPGSVDPLPITITRGRESRTNS